MPGSATGDAGFEFFGGDELACFHGANAFGGFAFPLGRVVPEANQVGLQLRAFTFGEAFSAPEASSAAGVPTSFKDGCPA